MFNSQNNFLSKFKWYNINNLTKKKLIPWNKKPKKDSEELI